VLRTVNIAWRSHRSVAEVRTWVDGSLLDTLRRAGYEVQSVTNTAQAVGEPGTEWVLLHQVRSTYWLLVSWIAWLWSKNQYWAVISLSPLPDGRSELLVAGDLPGQVAKLLKQLAAPAVPERMHLPVAPQHD
jgi:hypothetical protein